MIDPADRVFNGLGEPLALAMVERSPASPRVLCTRFERILGDAPANHRIAGLVERLADEDKIRPVDPDASTPTYGLTQQGARSLNGYRTLPAALAPALGHVLGRDAREEPTPNAPSTSELGGTSPVGSTAGWVKDALSALPDTAPIEAPYARFTFTRDASRNRWSLDVQDHALPPDAKTGSCPLTFLYLAGARLLTQPYMPATGEVTLKGPSPV